MLSSGDRPGHHRTEDLHLPQVGVAALLVVLDDGHLQQEGPHQLLVHVLQWDHHPAAGLLKVHNLDLLEVIEVGADPDGDPGGGVALVQLVVGVDRDGLDGCFPPELNVDEVRQLAV